MFHVFHVFKRKIENSPFLGIDENTWNTWNTWNICFLIISLAIVKTVFHVYNKNSAYVEHTWNTESILKWMGGVL